MSSLLALRASDRTGQAAACTFKAVADGTDLTTTDPTDPLFEIPAGTQTVVVTATPRRPVFWDVTFSFSVAADGSLTPEVDFRPRVQMRTAFTPVSRLTLANIKVSQFRDSTADVLDLLNHPPATRRVFNLKKKDWETLDKADEIEVKNHRTIYGPWPPPDWDLHAVPGAQMLDPDDPVKSGALNFAADPAFASDLNVDCVVLERAGIRMVPQYFAVAWPQAIAPKANASPTPFLLYFRQLNKYNGYDLNGIFVGPGLPAYPKSFDYADSGIFESLHYARGRGPLSNPNAKGVPYQVAASGADVVTVFPCNSFEAEFGDLNDPEDAETVLAEVQAFMFWRGGVDAPPASLGKTAVATFSSANFFLGNWLKDDAKRTGHFLSKVVNAVYFLDPMRSYKKDGKMIPVLDEFVASALKWSGEGTDRRIRLYMQFPWPSLEKLVKPLPAPPFFVTSSDRTRTVSVVTNATWRRAFGVPASKELPWVFVHHAVAATMLTHALARDDF